MTDIIKREGDENLPEKKLTDNETAEARKKFLVEKYFPKDTKVDLNNFIKYGVFKINIDKTGKDIKMDLIAKCDTQAEALHEIHWRAQYSHRPDNDIVLDNDKRFKTFRDETQHKDKKGNEIQHGDPRYKDMNHYIGMELEYTGDYLIYPIYEIR